MVAVGLAIMEAPEARVPWRGRLVR
jgi:hypothetical protein